MSTRTADRTSQFLRITERAGQRIGTSVCRSIATRRLIPIQPTHRVVSRALYFRQWLPVMEVARHLAFSAVLPVETTRTRRPIRVFGTSTYLRLTTVETPGPPSTQRRAIPFRRDRSALAD